MKARLDLMERGVQHGFTRALVGDDADAATLVMLVVETASKGGKSSSIMSLPPKAARHLAECLNLRADAVEQAQDASARGDDRLSA